jgi:predicted oxidoreductase
MEMSTLAVGMAHLARWQISDEQVVKWVEHCLAKGLTTFDNADIYGDYGCEARFGKTLQQRPSLREMMQLTTKCGIKMVSTARLQHRIKHYDTSKSHILASVDQSLRNFHTDYIDLLLIHRPDPLMDFAETAEAFVVLRDAGKVRHFGVSNFLPSQFDILESYLGFPIFTNQVEYSVLGLAAIETGALEHCQRKGIPLMAWSPLTAGRLFRRDTERSRAVFDTLQRIGYELGGTPVDQVALAWVLRHPTRVVPIIGANTPQQLESACAATLVNLSREQWFEIYAASRGFDVP